MEFTSPLANYYSQFGNSGQSFSNPGTKIGLSGANIDPSGKFGTAPDGSIVQSTGLGDGLFWKTLPEKGGGWTPNQQASQRPFGKNVPDTAIYGILDQTRFSNQSLFNEQERLIGQAADARVAGIDAALLETDRISQAGYQRARDFGIGAGGAADQSLIDSGLYSSSERLNAQRGVAGDTFRRYLDVDEAYAGTRSKLQAQRGQASAQGFENLANFYERVRSTNEQSYLYEFDARLGRGTPQQQQGGDDGTDWGAIIGTVLALLI